MSSKRNVTFYAASGEPLVTIAFKVEAIPKVERLAMGSRSFKLPTPSGEFTFNPKNLSMIEVRP